MLRKILLDEIIICYRAYITRKVTMRIHVSRTSLQLYCGFQGKKNSVRFIYQLGTKRVAKKRTNQREQFLQDVTRKIIVFSREQLLLVYLCGFNAGIPMIHPALRA